jgi:hypothetical protein
MLHVLGEEISTVYLCGGGNHIVDRGDAVVSSPVSSSQLACPCGDFSGCVEIGE